MLKIALTGNIASGKSYIEGCLKNKGFKTLCLDDVTKKIYTDDSVFQEKLAEIFNTSDINEISKVVFDDKRRMRKLENLIYPKIIDLMLNFFNENLNENFVFVSAPMLFEAGFEKYFDKVIYIKSDENIRLERLLKRNNYSVEYAKKRIKSQQKDAIKLKKADIIVENNGTLHELDVKCEKLIKGLDSLL